MNNRRLFLPHIQYSKTGYTKLTAPFRERSVLCALFFFLRIVRTMLLTLIGTPVIKRIVFFVTADLVAFPAMRTPSAPFASWGSGFNNAPSNIAWFVSHFIVLSFFVSLCLQFYRLILKICSFLLFLFFERQTQFGDLVADLLERFFAEVPNLQDLGFGAGNDIADGIDPGAFQAVVAPLGER